MSREHGVPVATISADDIETRQQIARCAHRVICAESREPVMPLSKEDREEIEELLSEKLNAASSARDKRLMSKIEGMFTKFEDRLKTDDAGATNEATNQGVDPAAQLVAPLQRIQGSQSAGYKASETVDPVYDRRLAALEEQLRQEQEARAAAEFEQTRQQAHVTMRDALAAKGITGVRANVLISHFEQSGALRLNDDGTPVLVVTRARAKGARPEELAFDIADGVEDWVQSSDAQEFMPARVTGRDLMGGGRNGLVPTTGPRPAGSLAQRLAGATTGEPTRAGAVQRNTPARDPVERTLDQMANAGVDPETLSTILFSDT